MDQGVLLVLGVLVVGAIGVISYVLDKKRRDKMRAYCLARGWTYVDEDPSLPDRWQGTPFGHGDRRRARNVMSGTESGRPFVAFDYSYDTHSTDSQGHRSTTTHRFNVCVIALPAFLPRLEVAPEGAMSRIASAVGFSHDIEFESEDFNRRFKVHANDPKFATDVLSPRTMQYLLTVPAESWRIDGTSMIWWADGRLEPSEIVVATSVMDRVAKGIPTFVWKDHGYDPQS
jgi:hypothetical protein